MSPAHLATWSPTAADPFDARKAAHLLRRAGFGASPDQVAKAVKDDVEALFDTAEDEERDFARTFEAITGQLADFRSVYATLLDRWLGCPAEKALGRAFPTLDLIRAGS